MQRKFNWGAGCLLASAALLAVTAFPARAATGDQGWHIGAAALFGEYSLDNNGVDDSSVGFKAYGGYRFNKYLGLEAAFINSGDFDEDTTPAEAGGDATVSATGFSLTALGYVPLPLDNIEVFGKVGFYNIDQDLELDGTDAGTRGADGITLGIGTDVAVAEQWAVRLEGDWYDLSGANFWTVGLGVSYQFGKP
jgi:opacity protein-like surface antigen